MPLNALVIFHGHGCHVLDPLLKRGFRHVFAVVQDDAGFWIRIDSKAGIPEVDVVGGPKDDLAKFWRGHGYTVLELERGTDAPRGPVINANCVGMVKCLLGLRAPFILTPWQLYRRLIK
jgi:hypothetical protein